MTKLLSLSHKAFQFDSERWFSSQIFAGVRFAIRRPSLAQRIELTRRVRDLMLKREFQSAGTEADQLEGTLADLLVRQLYLEWGLARIEGLDIDGEPATSGSLVALGPDELVEEIAACIQLECGLTENERKNS